VGDKSDSITPKMSAEELRQSWQGRALVLTADVAPKLCRVLMSLFADSYDETMPFLLHAAFGACTVTAPFLCSSPRINRAGQVTADLINKYGNKQKNYVVFDDERQMECLFRKLADRMKLDDAERIDLFICVRHWVKADFRLDPNFDRADPDAKRLSVH
jgi:hypothetical protein